MAANAMLPRAGSGLLGPARATLRSASARRRRRGISPARGPRLVAPPFGPRGPGSAPRLPLLDHRGGGRLHSATQARGAAAGVYPARGPHLAAPHVGPVGPARIPGLPLLVHRGCGRLRPATVARGAAAGPGPGARLAARLLRSTAPAGPARTHDAAAVLLAALRARGRPGRRDADDARRDHCMGGGRVLRPPWSPPARWGGDGGGDVPPPGKRRAGPVLKGKGVGRSPSLSSRMCSVRSILRKIF